VEFLRKNGEAGINDRTVWRCLFRRKRVYKKLAVEVKVWGDKPRQGGETDKVGGSRGRENSNIKCGRVGFGSGARYGSSVGGIEFDQNGFGEGGSGDLGRRFVSKFSAYKAPLQSWGRAERGNARGAFGVLKCPATY